MTDKQTVFAPAGQGTIELKVSSDETDGAMSMFLQTMPAKAATFTHIHTNCEETVYAIEGSIAVVIDGEAIDLEPGQSAVVPRNQPHAIANRGDGEAKFLFIVTPGGIEGFFRKAGAAKLPDPQDEAARVRSIAKDHGVVLVAPPAA